MDPDLNPDGLRQVDGIRGILLSYYGVGETTHAIYQQWWNLLQALLERYAWPS